MMGARWVHRSMGRSLDFPAALRAAGRSLVSKPESAARNGRIVSNAQIPVLQFGRRGEFGGAAGPDGAAAFENVMAVGEAQQRRDVLVDQEDRLSGRFERRQYPPDLGADARRQPLRRLVQDQQA